NACPPLRALLTIMADGSYEGKDVHHPEIRRMFTQEAVEESAWYRERLVTKQQLDERTWRNRVEMLNSWLSKNSAANESFATEVAARRQLATAKLEKIMSTSYLDQLRGTLGVDVKLLDRA